MTRFVKFLCLCLCLMMSAMCFSPAVAPVVAEQDRYCDTGYNNSGNTTTSTETLTYTSYTNPVEIFTELELPPYTYVAGTNTCAPTAGAVVCGFYDYYNTNLIPNFTPYYDDGTGYMVPYATGTAITALKADLYTRMGTNVGGDGTTQSGFWSGLSSYATQQGYTLSYTSIGSNNISTPLAIQSAFNQNQLVVLFVNAFRYCAYNACFIGDTSYTMLFRVNPNAGHVFVASGYLELYFYQGNNVIQAKRMLEVSYGDCTTGLLELNSFDSVDCAYTCSIS